MSKKDGRIVIWPAYFDSSKTRRRKDGPQIHAVESPTAEEIYDACLDLKLASTLEPAKRLPSGWWERQGRVLVTKKETKMKSLLAISKVLMRKRQQRKAP
jgi:signal recognition particle subunit SEC65